MNFSKQFFYGACISIALTVNTAQAAFPDDFTEGVILVEETGRDGNARRAMGFNDGGINGNVPGLREFLNGASVDNTLIVQQGRVDATFGRELDFIHDQRGTWPNGPRNDGLNNVNGVVWLCAQVPGIEPWACGTWEYIKKGKTERSLLATWFPPGRRLRFQPLDTFGKPAEGTVLGFFLSGITRNGIAGRNNIRARTNVAFFRVGEQPGNGVMLTPQEVEKLFGKGTPPVGPVINSLLDDD